MKKIIILSILFIFLLSSFSFAWLTGYTYKRTVLLNSTVATNLTNYPAYFVLDTATLISNSKMQTDCDDIRVTDSSDSSLDYDVENCNAANTIVWVRIPNLLDTKQLTNISVYYKNSTIANGENPTGVYSNDFISVWHFDNDLYDVLGRNDLTSSGTFSYATSNCKFGKCASFDSTTTYLSKTSPVSLPNTSASSTFSGWQYKTVVSGSPTMLAYGPSSASNIRQFMLITSPQKVRTSIYGTDIEVTANWQGTVNYVAGVIVSGTSYTTLNATSSSGTFSPNTITGTLYLGKKEGAPATDFYGYGGGTSQLDEFRIANVSRSSDWRGAEFGQTYSLGSEASQFITSLENANETENKSIQISLDSSRIWDIVVYYNNTLVKSLTGQTQPLNVSVIAPLVSANMTLIPWNVTINTTDQTETQWGNQSVQLWYYPQAYTYTYPVITNEEQFNMTVGLPSKPASSPASVTYDAHYRAFERHEKIYASGTISNMTANSSYLTDTNLTSFIILPTHLSESGLIMLDHYLNETYNLSYSATAESTSSKVISENRNTTRDYFIWLTNSTNGTINGAANISNIFNITFYDEDTLGILNIDTATYIFTAFFPDGNLKTYSFGHASLNNSIIRGYPDGYTANVSSLETYSKTGYVTRNRYVVKSETPLNTQQGISVYMLNSSIASYVVITIQDNGNAVEGAYVQILKYFGGTGTYLSVDQKITDDNGQAGSYLRVDAYYKFAVYDSSGNQLYMSPSPVQIICNAGTCTKTIDISGESALNYITPYYSANCYGNNDTNTIIFSFADQTGKTRNVSFLAWRANNITELYAAPVCNYTVSASSAGYNCVLSAPENMSRYDYICAIDISASPWVRVFGKGINFAPWNAITDWFMVVFVAIVGMAAIAINPGIGMILTAVTVGLLHYLGVVNLPTYSWVGILIVGLLGAFLMWRDD